MDSVKIQESSAGIKEKEIQFDAINVAFPTNPEPAYCFVITT
jgi:hypothetical protein